MLHFYIFLTDPGIVRPRAEDKTTTMEQKYFSISFLSCLQNIRVIRLNGSISDSCKGLMNEETDRPE